MPTMYILGLENTCSEYFVQSILTQLAVASWSFLFMLTLGLSVSKLEPTAAVFHISVKQMNFSINSTQTIVIKLVRILSVSSQRKINSNWLQQ